MTESKGARLSKLAKEYNLGIHTIVEFLKKKGHEVEDNPNTKITGEMVVLLEKEYSTDKSVKKDAEKLNWKTLREKKESISLDDVNRPAPKEDEEEDDEVIRVKTTQSDVKVVGKIDLEKINPKVKKEAPKLKVEEHQKPIEEPKPVKAEEPKKIIEEVKPVKEKKPKEENFIPTEKPESEIDLKVLGKIDLDALKTKKTTKIKKNEEVIDEIKIVEKPIIPVVDKKEEVVIEPEIEEIEEEIETEGAEEEIEEEVETSEVVVEKADDNFIKTQFEKLSGPTVIGKINLEKIPEDRKRLVASSNEEFGKSKKKKRKRIKLDQKVDVATEKKAKPITEADRDAKNKKNVQPQSKRKPVRPEVDEDEVQRQIKETLARLTAGKTKSKTVKYRRDKRDLMSQRHQEEIDRQELDKQILRVTEFVTVSELASMMNVQSTQVISTCMSIGLFVSINQRIDAETISMVAEEFGYSVEFITADLQDTVKVEVDDPKDLKPRPPIVTVMGHVDHGKTKLLDHIRKANVIAGEAGGITQHIGAYHVTLESGREISFLDTPGHEAFTAMRARGAKVTDISIIVIAADDGIMPQTKEAINHAQAAGVPMVFAINKIDKPTANPEKIREQLSAMNILVEEWGGKYQTQEISAKEGTNVNLLLDKVLLEADMLELKANPDRKAYGTIIESTLDKGRGYVATVLVQNGTLKNGDMVLSGSNYGIVKALFNERGKKLSSVGPAQPALILGLNGAPQAGETFTVIEDEREAKDIANRREQLQREQTQRTRKHITLDEIGRRIAIGNFKELNVIIKGDVDGSIEALADSLLKLSTQEIQVNIIHKAVGQISESDVLLAAASNAIIIGFQVRPSVNARRLAENEQIDIRLYSIIYSAIEEIKAAMEGMLSPEIREEIVATLEVREVFKINKVGNIAGCMVREGKIQRSSKVRVIRDGIVIHSGELGTLKRFKEDVKEVGAGLDCGLNITNFNDIQAGDVVEGYKETEVKKTL